MNRALTSRLSLLAATLAVTAIAGSTDARAEPSRGIVILEAKTCKVTRDGRTNDLRLLDVVYEGDRVFCDKSGKGEIHMPGERISIAGDRAPITIDRDSPLPALGRRLRRLLRNVIWVEGPKPINVSAQGGARDGKEIEFTPANTAAKQFAPEGIPQLRLRWSGGRPPFVVRAFREGRLRETWKGDARVLDLAWPVQPGAVRLVLEDTEGRSREMNIYPLPENDVRPPAWAPEDVALLLWALILDKQQPEAHALAVIQLLEDAGATIPAARWLADIRLAGQSIRRGR